MNKFTINLVLINDIPKIVHLSKVIFHKIVNITRGGKLFPRKLKIPNSGPVNSYVHR